MPSNKLIPNVEYQAHQVGTTTKFQDGMLVTRRRQLEKDKFKRRYNVSYVLDGKFHDLVDWETCYNSSTPDKIKNMLLQGVATIKVSDTGKVSSSFTKKQLQAINKTALDELLKK